MTLKVGADPEFFLRNGDKFVSAFDMVPGTKQKPHPVPSGAVQVDGMALEFNIDPATTETEFVYNINEVLGHLRGMVPEEFDFAFEATAFFSKKHMDEQPDEARELGCDPDFNVYTGDVNPQPDEENTYRTAAGHIHLGWYDKGHKLDDQHIEEVRMLTKQLDYMLGIPSLIFDDDATRRQMYGQAGTYRLKDYGMEYRVLSNFWLKSDAMMSWVFKHTEKAFALLSEDGVIFHDKWGTVARNIIDSHDTKAAKKFLENQMKEFVDMEIAV